MFHQDSFTFQFRLPVIPNRWSRLRRNQETPVAFHCIPSKAFRGGFLPSTSPFTMSWKWRFELPRTWKVKKHLTLNVALLLSGNFYSRIDDQCECPVPCESISFNPILSYATFPSKNFFKWIVKEHDGSNVKPDVIKREQEEMRYSYCSFERWRLCWAMERQKFKVAEQKSNKN